MALKRLLCTCLDHLVPHLRQLFRGRPVKHRPPPATSTGVCPRPTLLDILLTPPDRPTAGAERVRTVRSAAGRPDPESGARCWRHLESMRDRAAEREFERLRCARPGFEHRLLVLNEVFTS